MRSRSRFLNNPISSIPNLSPKRAADPIDPEEVERDQRRSTADLIESVESKPDEYKQTARYNSHIAKVDENLEHSVFKSVAGFMNAAGGVLLIGSTTSRSQLGWPTTSRRLAVTVATASRIGSPRSSNVNWVNRPQQRSLTLLSIIFQRATFAASTCGRVRSRSISVRAPSSMFGMGNSTCLCTTRDAMEYERSGW